MERGLPRWYAQESPSATEFWFLQSKIPVTHNYVTPREISQEINMVIKKSEGFN